ncbi:MAG: ATP-binding protein [Bacillota bacterium]
MPPFPQMPGFKRQLLLIVIILLIVPVLVMLYDVYFASKTDDILIVNLEKKLTGIAGGLGAQIEEQLFREPAEKRMEALAAIFDQAAGPVAQANSGVRLGLYIPDNDQIIIHGYLHEFGKRLPEEKKEREQRIYQEALKGIAAVMKSGEPITRLGRTWDDQFLEHLVPVRSDSRIIAVLWAEERMHPLFARSTKIRLFIRYITLTVFSFGVLASLLTITSLVRQVRTIKNGLLELEHNFAYRLPEMSGEMGQITGAINTLAAGLAEREQTIEQLRRSENLIALGKLVTHIAHELRNPVSIIQAVSEVLASRLKNSPELKGYAEYVTKIQEQIERHNRLVGELLDFGRPDPGLIAPLSLNELISAILGDCALLLQQKKIALEFAPCPEPLIIQGNQEKLKQVLINLLLNAVQAMPKGGKLTVRTEAVNHTARVLVRDTGVGISKEDLPQIFTPFYTKKAGGSGLGLAISQRIVQIHGGSISVESEPGAGTTFILSFPRSQPEEENKTLSSDA